MSDPAVLQRFHNPESGYKWHTRTLAKSDDGPPRHIKVIEHPGVYLVAAMKLQDKAVNAYLADHQISTFSPWGYSNDPDEFGGRNARGTDHELMVELSGRVCYMSYDRPRPGGAGAFIDNIRKEGHGSVFEHPHYSFILTGISRNLSLEANRHRTFNISQLSGRFVDASEVGFVCDPDMLPLEHEPPSIEFDGWAESCRRAFDSYDQQHQKNHARQWRNWSNSIGAKPPNLATPDKPTERKIVKKARERARDILPGCLETRVWYTINARAIRFVFEKRCHADAAFEIRRAFNGVYRLMKAHDPKLFVDYSETPLPDGTFSVETAFGKI